MKNNKIKLKFWWLSAAILIAAVCFAVCFFASVNAAEKGFGFAAHKTSGGAANSSDMTYGVGLVAQEERAAGALGQAKAADGGALREPLPPVDRSQPVMVRDSSKEFFNTTEGMVYNFYMPYDTKSMKISVDDSDVEVKLEPKDANYLYGGEVSVWFQHTIKTTGNHTIRYYKTDDASDLMTPLSIGTMELRKWLDGIAPKAQKNSLNTILNGNVWNVEFSVEEPDSAFGNFWAKSGVKSVTICKKEGKDTFVPIAGKSWTFADHKTFVDIEFEMPNEKGDYFAELMDAVGNKVYYGILSISQYSEPYYEALSFASQYAKDANLNGDLRRNVEEALGVFLEALNNKETGELFVEKQRALNSAMRAVVEAKEAHQSGKHRVVVVENLEYLPFGLTAELDEGSYDGKILVGDRLELRITVAKFLMSDYNSAAKAFAPTGTNTVLRFSAKLLLNGKEVSPKNPINVYIGIPSTYKNIAMTFSDASESVEFELQKGAEWVLFSVGQGGVYDMFFNDETQPNTALWWLLLLLILPIGGVIAWVVLRKKKAQKKVLLIAKQEKDASQQEGFSEDSATLTQPLNNVNKKMDAVTLAEKSVPDKQSAELSSANTTKNVAQPAKPKGAVPAKKYAQYNKKSNKSKKKR